MFGIVYAVYVYVSSTLCRPISVVPLFYIGFGLFDAATLCSKPVLALYPNSIVTEHTLEACFSQPGHLCS